MTVNRRRRRRVCAPGVVCATVAQWERLAFGGRSRAWLDQPHDHTRSTWYAINAVVKFLGDEGRPLQPLDVVALELIDGDEMRGSALLIVDQHARTRTGVISWTRSVVTGVGGAQIYMHAPNALRRLAKLLAGNVVALALGGGAN
jgi:hypothetical protein